MSRIAMVAMVLVLAGCDPSVMIGDPVDADTGGGGGSVTGGGVGGGSTGGGGGLTGGGGGLTGGGGGLTGGGGGVTGGGGGSVTGGGGGATGGGGGATGGGGGALNAMGCPGTQSCSDVTGQNDFACVQGTAIPSGSPSCSNTVACASGSTCYLTTMGSNVGVCLRDCPGTGTGGGGGTTGGGGGAAQVEPVFVSATAPLLGTQMLKLTLAFPTPNQPGDFLIALIDADEGTGPATLATPPGWTLVGGWPIHNLNSQHTPYIIPMTQNHGTWIFTHFVVAAETPSVEFTFSANTTARGAIVAYRGVNTLTPVHDKTGYGLYGDGDTNGFGAGNTTLNAGTQVSLITTATTAYGSYTTTYETGGIVERVNSGENPNGLNLIIHDDTIYPRIYLAPNVRHFQSPSSSSASFMYSIATLLLTPL
ncbi:MAG: hypothetical protein Q8L48_09395 [Archangium sp.]|nr:hypothetical protein [Archangium sp.]